MASPRSTTRPTSGATGPTRFRIDATRCDGQGVCVVIAPELFALDRYGLAYVVPGSDRLLAEDDEVVQRGRDADAMCPRNAIREEAIPIAPVASGPGASSPDAPPPRSTTPPDSRTDPSPPAVPRLRLDGPQSVEGWRSAGGWRAFGPEQIVAEVESAGLLGQGGAGYPTVAKWRRLAAGRDPVVIVNGAEREPGTIKDHYLMAERAGLVLDGLRLTMAAVGSSEAIIAVDEDADREHAALSAGLAEAAAADLLTDLRISIRRVPARYVAGEETALINSLDGGPALPRLRPPFPGDVGLSGRPTVVHNVETIGSVALALALGAAVFTSVGAAGAPGTGLFSVSTFGGPVELVERPYGTPLRALLADTGVLDGARAVLVGGYAGGLLPDDQLDVPLAPGPLAEIGLTLGTKSMQVVGHDRCPVGVAADIAGYFAAETARQCPPCTRGLPDMATTLRGLESGETGDRDLAGLEEFVATLPGRGVCRLPDGAARLVSSLLGRFAGDVAAHTGQGCPLDR